MELTNLEVLLDEHFEDIIEDITSGETLRNIAIKHDVSLTKLHNFLEKKQSARVSLAFKISAQSYSDKAIEALKGAKGTLAEIARARELASHYRWAASKRNPKDFGDKIQIDTPPNPLSGINVDQFNIILNIARSNAQIAGSSQGE